MVGQGQEVARGPASDTAARPMELGASRARACSRSSSRSAVCRASAGGAAGLPRSDAKRRALPRHARARARCPRAQRPAAARHGGRNSATRSSARSMRSMLGVTGLRRPGSHRGDARGDSGGAARRVELHDGAPTRASCPRSEAAARLALQHLKQERSAEEPLEQGPGELQSLVEPRLRALVHRACERQCGTDSSSGVAHTPGATRPGPPAACSTSRALRRQV